ncbi:MAG: TIGR01777 family oxidoreductase [Pseudomonadota bacterium]
MHVVIAGGSGLVGRALTANLISDGRQVTVLSRNPARRHSSTPPSVSFVQWDGRTAGDWIGALNGAGAVVNLAGESIAGEGFFPDRWSADKKNRIRDSRIGAGRAIVQAFEKVERKPAVLVQASAVGYYGPRGDEEVTEDEPAGDDFLSSVCVDWEAATAPVEAMGVRRVVVRVGLVLTPDGGALPRLVLPHKWFAGGYFGHGRQWWPWIHLDDVAAALRFTIDNESAGGPMNFTAPTPVTSRAFGKALGRVMRRPSYAPVPAFAMRLLVGEVASIVLDGQRVVPGRLQALGYTFRFTDLEKALADLLAEK